MRFLMRQKFFSFGDSFSIKDENENDVFTVEGQVFSFGDKLSFQDMGGNEIFFIKQKITFFGNTYEIYQNGELYGVLTKELLTFFNCRFNIETSNYGNIEVEGDFTDHEYSFSKNGRTIASISKQWFSWTDSYGIDIAPGENEAFILACVVIIDMICHDKHN